MVIAIPTPNDRGPAEAVARLTVRLGDGLLVAVGGPGAADATVPRSVIHLPGGIGPAAERLADALATRPG